MISYTGFPESNGTTLRGGFLEPERVSYYNLETSNVDGGISFYDNNRGR